MKTREMPHGVVGFKFAQALVDGDYEKAQIMLSAELKAKYTPLILKENFDQMSELFQLEPYEFEQQDMAWIEVMDNGFDHPEMDAKGWAYISIGTEAVTITVKAFGPEYLITELVWGRP
jgi:hypothetical protein